MTAAAMPADRSPSPISLILRSRLANVGNQLLVPRPVEHDDDQVFDVAVHAFGNVLQIVDHRRVEVHRAFAGRADHDFFHVAVRRIQQSAAFGSGQHGDGARRARGAQVRAFQGIDGDVHFGNFGSVGKFGADFFADVEHGRFIAFAFANHDGAAHGNRVHGFAHGFGGHLVGQLAFALAHGVGRGDGGSLHHPQES